MKVGVRGTFSQLQVVGLLSGVPQCIVLGPLFLLFVNKKLLTWIINEIKMFADDTKLWCRIKIESDGVTLQQDIDYLSTWYGTENVQLCTSAIRGPLNII